MAKYRTLEPLHDRVVAIRLDSENVTESFIETPDHAKEKPTEGEVLAVGTGKILPDGQVVKIAVNVGDKIIFGKYAGVDYEIGGQTFLVLREDEILCRIVEVDDEVKTDEEPRAADNGDQPTEGR